MKTYFSEQELASAEHLRDPSIGQWMTREADGQVLGARLFTPSAVIDRQIIIDGTAYSVHASTPRDVDRTSRLAEESGMVTISLEIPSMSPYSGPLSREQIESIKANDWSVLGAEQWKLIDEMLASRGITHSVDDPLTVHYAGFSLSATTNIGLVQSAPASTRTGHFVAWENTAWEQNTSKFSRLRRIGSLVLGMVHGGKGLKKYQTQASPIPETLRQDLKSEESNGFRNMVIHKFADKWSGWTAPVLGMAKGGDAEKLRDALVARNEQESAVAHIWNGEKSWLSKTKANKYGAGILEAAGIQVDLEHDEDGRHGVEDATLVSIRRYVAAILSMSPTAA